MTDINFDKLLLRLSKANEKYKDLLNKAEEEFKNRYGDYPSDIDYDSWIDIYHCGIGFISAKQINEEMKSEVYKRGE